MLPLLALNIDTGARTKKTHRGERERERAAKVIAKSRRLEARQRKDIQLNILGPILDEHERKLYIEQIHEDVESICDNKINQAYAIGRLPRYTPDDAPMGSPMKPFLWVVTGEVAGQSIPTVFGFAYATLKNPPDAPSTFDMKLICSRGGVGMPLFKEVLKYARDNQPSLIFANLFTLAPINRVVSKKYEDAAQEFMGRPLKYMKDGQLTIVLNPNEVLHNILDDETVSQEEFYAKVEGSATDSVAQDS